MPTTATKVTRSVFPSPSLAPSPASLTAAKAKAKSTPRLKPEIPEI